METSDALFELSLMNAESQSGAFEDFYIWAADHGVPPEILTRLKPVWDTTKAIAGEVVSVGKVIIQAIVDFVKENPGIAIGLAIGAVVGVLVAGVPFLGPILAPVATAVAAIYGAGVGAALDAGESTVDATNPVVAAINLARKFLDLLVTIFMAIRTYWEAAS